MRKKKADPLLDAGLRGCIKNMAVRNFWRVANWYELDDLIQDGYLCYVRVRRAYPKVKDPAHITALLKTTFHRHIIDLANEKREGSEIALTRLDPEHESNDVLEVLLGGAEGEQVAMVMLHSMPQELLALWRFLRSEDGREKLREPRLKYRGVRETTNEHLCRLLGFNPRKVDLELLAKAHFFP